MFGLHKKIAELKEENATLNKLLRTQIDRAVKRLEELEQHKLYYVVMKDATESERNDFKHVFEVVKNNLQWTVPNIIILDKEITELTDEELGAIKLVKREVKR